ncbi:UNVERIFIED_CONTAM: hypothetical protein Sindi_0535000 [Sesamum indicum]
MRPSTIQSMGSSIVAEPIPPPEATKVNSSPTGLFVGNILLRTCTKIPTIDDKIAHASNKSSRKLFLYIAPMMQNGEVIVRLTLEAIRNESQRWKPMDVGYFLGKRPYFHHLKEYVTSICLALREVTAAANDFFFFQFKSVIDMEELKHTQVLVWIKLRHLPIELWTTEGFSRVASGVGKSLYPDATTRACTRLDFGRICVMLDINSKLPKHIIIMTPDEDGGESSCKVDVEYEWLPPKCTTCMSLGHPSKDCSLNKVSKPAKPPVSVYVPKTGPTMQPSASVDKEETTTHRSIVHKTPILRGDRDGGGKGKELVIYNTFDAFNLLDDETDDTTQGPKASSPTSGDPC